MTDARPDWLMRQFPFEPHYHDLGGYRMHYVDEGRGPVVVMLHGNPTWSFFFRRVIESLSDRFRVIVPDHIGCGLSDKPADYEYTLASRIRDVRTLIDHLKLEDVSLVVHDWGGAIGFGWAVEQPARVRSLVVMNTAAFLGGKAPWRIRVCGWPVVSSLAVRGLNAFAVAATYMACAKRERMTADVRAGYLWPYDSIDHRRAVHQFVRDIPLTPRVPSYSVIRSIEERLALLAEKPMMIAWGMRDFCFTPWFLEQWKRRFARAEVHEFQNAGHYLLEDAHEEVVPLIGRFLDRHQSPLTK